MSIPLDQLYHYVEQLIQDSWGGPVIIYRFYPHGSKLLKNLRINKVYNDLEHLYLYPHLYCNDQEPLDYDRYEVETKLPETAVELNKLIKSDKFNLRDYPREIWDYAWILHSEQRSSNLKKYQDSRAFVPIYYWSHAVIAQDWFRAFEHIHLRKHADKKLFLIYNRAWSGTREYRLKFIDMLIDAQLVPHCLTSVAPIDSELELHYTQHQFKNDVWKPTHQLEDHFPLNKTSSVYSAVVEHDDYNQTDIEVVLETLFDDDRLHLTEKSLRPVALGQPFILLATHGSLEYLRQYGFKTYSDIWSEEYDAITDPMARMKAIVKLLQDIASWSPAVRKEKLKQAQTIAEYNKNYFFSKDFLKLITNELDNNIKQAVEYLLQHDSGKRIALLNGPNNDILNSLLNICYDMERLTVQEVYEKLADKILIAHPKAHQWIKK